MRFRRWFVGQQLSTPGVIVGLVGLACAIVFASGELSEEQALLFSNYTYAPSR